MKWALFGVAILVSAVAYWLWPASVCTLLVRRSIPPLPHSAMVIGSDSGGTLTRWLLVAASLDASRYAAYRAAVEMDGGRTYHVPEQAIVMPIEDSPAVSDPGVAVFWKQKVNGIYFPWWSTDQITSGLIIEKLLPDDCGYVIYFDDLRKTVYIYWHFG